MKSIQHKILFVVIIGLIVITAVVSTIGVNMTHEIMHRDADRILNNVTQKEAAIINDVLGDIQKSSSIMAHYARSKVSSLSQLEDKEFLEKYLEDTKKMFSEIALKTNGAEGFFLRINPEYADSTTGYYVLIGDKSELKSMPVTDLSKYPENDVKNVGWYYTSVKKGEPAWLEPYYFPGYSQQLISYTIPLYVDSELLGVLGFDMDFGYLIDRVENISVYERGYSLLLDKDGNAYNEVERETSENPHTKSTAELKNGMMLELRADYKDIQKDIHPMLSKIVLAFIIVMVVAIVYTIFVTHRIVRPLKQLTAAAENIASGVNSTYFENISVNTKDEIGTLTGVLKNAYEKLQEYTKYINALAYKDSLTGIKNSTAYTEAIAELNKEINHGNPRFAVMVADINNLKQTNDNFGHDVGNELIVHTAKILTDTFKNSTVFRIGGDEFAVLLKNTDYENYRILLEKLDEACSNDYIDILGKRIPVSIARGVASFNPDIDTLYEDVFAKADQAMYMNKEQSKAALV